MGSIKSLLKSFPSSISLSFKEGGHKGNRSEGRRSIPPRCRRCATGTLPYQPLKGTGKRREKDVLGNAGRDLYDRDWSRL